MSDEEKIKVLLKRFLDAWQASHEEEAIAEEDREDCRRCGGFLYIEQGGDTVDCTVCKGSGFQPTESKLNLEMFAEKAEDIMFNTDGLFFELLGEEVHSEDDLPF